jgi:hypothetical protein
LQELVESALAATPGGILRVPCRREEAAEISLDGPEKLVLAGRLLELTAARKMPDDFKFVEEPDDPVEPDDDEADDRDYPESSELGDEA